MSTSERETFAEMLQRLQRQRDALYPMAMRQEVLGTTRQATQDRYVEATPEPYNPMHRRAP